MSKLTAENWWAEIDGDEYKVKDGGAVATPFPVRWVNQRGSGDMGSEEVATGLQSGQAITFPLLVDASELAALNALKGTKPVLRLIDKTGGATTERVDCDVAYDHSVTATIGDNVELAVSAIPQGLPRTPDLSHLDTSAA
jgi:hypothetical protein